MNNSIARYVPTSSGSLLICLIFLLQGIQAQNTSHYQPFITQRGLLHGAMVFTVEFWVKTNESKGNAVYWQRPYLFGNETNGDNSGDFGITVNNGYIGMFEGLSSLNTDQQFLSTSIRVNDNFFHNITAVNNGQTINLYVDGNIVGSLVSGRQLNTNNAPLTFGAASLDHSYAGNNNNTNFVSQSTFGDVRISNTARYAVNFQPQSNFISDNNTVALFHFNNQGNGNGDGNGNGAPINIDPNNPVTLDPAQGISYQYAQQATLFINDTTVLYGKLLLAKKNWSFNNDIGIHFYEGSNKKPKFYKPEEIKAFAMGTNYYEPKFLAQGGSANTPSKKTMVRRLSPEGSKMVMFEYLSHTSTKNGNGTVSYNDEVVTFVQLPNTKDDKIYQFTDNKFTPKFDERVSKLFSDKPALAEKISHKDKDFFYPFVTSQGNQLRVWWNIVNEYNKP